MERMTIVERKVDQVKAEPFPNLKQKERPYIPPEDRLVPPDFTYTQDDIRREVIAAANKHYGPYPTEGLKMSEEQFDGMSHEQLVATLVGTPDARPSYFYDMPHRYDASGTPRDGEDVAKMGPEDFANAPMHPNIRDLATQTERGVIGGPGFYYRLGANRTADCAIVREHNGKLQILLIDRGDEGGIALPGGMVERADIDNQTDPAEIARKVAMREVGEEAAIKGLENVKPHVVLKDSVVGDFRATAFAWPETTLVLFMPDKEATEAMVPQVPQESQTEIKEAGWKYTWKDLNSDNFFGSHASYVKLAIQKWQDKTGLVVDKEGTIGRADAPENFRGEEAGYYPQVIVNDTPRLRALKDAIAGVTDNEKVAERLFDLVVYNAYGRVHPIPNSCSDFIGVVNPSAPKSESLAERIKEKAKYLARLHRLKYRNCVALVRVGGKLALLGGYNDIGEAMTQTTAREALEEGNVRHLNHALFFSERSLVNRDNGPVVISSCSTGLVDKYEMEGGDDAKVQDEGGRRRKKKDKGVYFVKLQKRGRFNTEFLQERRLRDVDGNVFQGGMRGDHTELLKQLYNYWQDHKRRPHESLASTIKRQSRLMPQEWFGGYAHHEEGVDNYGSLTRDKTTGAIYLESFDEVTQARSQETQEQRADKQRLPFSQNIAFTLEKATQIFKEAGYEDAEAKARQFVVAAADTKADMLPPFPQASVTVDCLVVKENSLLVQKMPDGSYRLPGSFYSPEKVQAGKSLAQFANETVANRYGGIDFNAHMYLGTVGGDVALGHQADKRRPRLSHVYLGRTTAKYDRQPEFFQQRGEEVEIEEIPIWKQDEHNNFVLDGQGRRILSDQITAGKWGFEHNREIIMPLLGRAMDLLLETGKGATAEEMLLQERLP